MSSVETDLASIARAAARGWVAAMSMTGVRELTANLGLMESSPPEAIVERHGPRPVRSLRPEHRAAVIQVLHWCYGAGGGAVFGLLPRPIRAHPMTGPMYGLVVWLIFELGIAPALGLHTGMRRGRHRPLLGRAVVAGDHLLYGFVVAGRLAPEPDVVARERGGRPPDVAAHPT